MRGSLLNLIAAGLLAGSALGAAAQSIEDLCARVARYGFGEGGRDFARLTERIRTGSARAKEAAEIERVLVNLLQNGDATPEARAFACRQLALVGGEAAAAALRQLLDDPVLAASARAALEVMPSPLATKALTNALPKLSGNRLVGALNTLGERRDAAALPALTRVLTNGPPAAVHAAAAALGKIGGGSARAALRALAANFDPAFGANAAALKLPPSLVRELDRRVVTVALLQTADQLLQAGDAEAAGAVYREVYLSTAVPPYCRVAALRGLVEVAPESALPVVLGLVDSEDPALRAVGLSLLRRLTSVGVLQLLARLPHLEPAVQAVLVEVLAERGEAALAPTFLELTRSAAPPVRRAAVRALGRAPAPPGTVQRLGEIAAAADPLTAAAARETLPQLHGPGVEAAFLEGIGRAPEPVRAELIRAIVPRGEKQALPVLLEAATTGDEPLRIAALNGLGALAEPGQFPLLIEFLRAAETNEEREAALAALKALGRRLDDPRTAARTLAAAYPQADPALRAALLEACPVVPGPATLQLVDQAARGESRRRLRALALAALAAWPEEAALKPLLALLTTRKDPDERMTALRGWTRLLEQPSSRIPRDTIRQLQLALPITQTAAERRVLLGELGNVVHPAGLDVILPFLTDPEVRMEAALAAIRVAQYLGGVDPAAATNALAQITRHIEAKDILAAAEAARKRVTAWAGAVETWLVAGPVLSADTRLFSPPAPASSDPAGWRLLSAPAGRLRLEPLPQAGPQSAVLRVRLETPASTPARLRLRHRAAVQVRLGDQDLSRRAPDGDAGERPAVAAVSEFPLSLGPEGRLLEIRTWRPADGSAWELEARILTADGHVPPGLRCRAE